MASDYYDSDTNCTTSGTTFTITSDASSSTTATPYYTITTMATGTAQHYYYPPPRRYLIPKPDQWTREQELAFVRLLNEQTHTGWKVEMLISGDVLICDPNIEKRSMEDFVPLLKLNASATDKAAIRAFFNDNPIS